jgi:hypothetical protein
MSDPARLPASYDVDLSREPRHIDPIGDYALIDPDCRDGKHGSCVGGPCECACHVAEDSARIADFDSE